MNQTIKTILARYGKHGGLFLIRHRFTVLLVAVALYFLFWPKAVFRSAVEPGTTGGVGHSNAAVSQADPVPLYDPTAEDADPTWSLPAELKAGQLQALASQVEKLLIDTTNTTELEAERATILYEGLLHQKVKDLLWPSLRGSGFKDQRLPLDWYALVKQYYDVVGMTADASERIANHMAQIGIQMRLESVKIRVIGGKVLTGDLLFVKALQTYIDHRQAYLSKAIPPMLDVVRRLRKEFPDAMEDVIDSVGPSVKSELQRPSRRGSR
jgi:hypothetical protein